MKTGTFSKSRLRRHHDVMTGSVERGEVHVEANGNKAVGSSDPVRRDTIVRIASMSKPITAAAGNR